MSTTTTWALDRHTEVAPDGTARVDGLRGFGGAHGGHLAAIALRAMGERLADPGLLPRTSTTTFLAPVGDGPVAVAAQAAPAGRTLATATARLEQHAQPVVLATATFGRDRGGPDRLDRAMPAVPPPEDSAPLGAEPVPGSSGLGIEHRPAAPPLPLTGGDEPRISVWMRLTDDRPVDALGALVLADGAVPGLYGALDAFVAMPTIELSAHFADLQAAAGSPWLLGVFTNLHAGAGYAVEDGKLWTPDGALVAVTRQLRRIRGA